MTGAAQGESPVTGAAEGEGSVTGAAQGESPVTGAAEGESPVTGAAQGDGHATAVPWRRLSVRIVYLALLRAAISAVPGYLGLVWRDDGPVWALVAGSVVGLAGALGDLARWRTTRYRVAPDRVEMRSGWLARKHRTVRRERIRSVDTSASGLARVLGLRTVSVGSGESGSSFRLNALDREHAARLERELMSGAKADLPADDAAPEPETVIARLRRDWVPLNVVRIWAPLAVAGPAFALYWYLREAGIDLLGFARGLLDANPFGPIGTVVALLVVTYPLGVALNAAAFVLENWNFQLVRAGTAPATALVTRKGLLTTRTVHRDDGRLRGLAFREPLVWRWLRLVETSVLVSGLGGAGGPTTSGVLPRIRRDEARELATRILPDGGRPMEAPLVRHPRGALVRRLVEAVVWPPVYAAGLLLLGALDLVPDWLWPLPLLLLPVTPVHAVLAYRSLGHALAGPYLVLRKGASRKTVALQRRAVIGWTFQQSLLQRRRGLVTVRVATAAGERTYELPDAGMDQALALVRAATPELAAGCTNSAAPADPEPYRDERKIASVTDGG